MRAHGLVGAHASKKWRRGNDKMVPAPELLQRDFSAERLDLRWVADITELHCLDGKLSLAEIRDLCDHTLVGWSIEVISNRSRHQRGLDDRTPAEVYAESRAA
jgi:putative transposase